MDIGQAFYQNPDGTLALNTVIGSTVTCINKAPTGTAVLLSALNNSRTSISLRNVGTVDVYIGGSAVATTTGYPLLQGEEIKFDGVISAIYGRTSGGTADIRVCEISH